MAKLYTDGGARGNPGVAGCSAILFSDDGQLMSFTGEFYPYATNNFAEYSALLIGLKMAIKNNIKQLNCFLDSELVVKQLTGEYKVKDENIKTLHSKVKKYIEEFNTIDFNYIPREQNKHADRLVNLILDIKTK